MAFIRFIFTFLVLFSLTPVVLITIYWIGMAVGVVICVGIGVAFILGLLLLAAHLSQPKRKDTPDAAR